MKCTKRARLQIGSIVVRIMDANFGTFAIHPIMCFFEYFISPISLNDALI